MECAAMLPCQNSCPHYREGCHKTCSHWKTFVQRNGIEREKKKKYLAFYGERCSTVIRQCYRIMPSFLYR